MKTFLHVYELLDHMRYTYLYDPGISLGIGYTDFEGDFVIFLAKVVG